MANVTGGPELGKLAPRVPELIARWCGWNQGADADVAEASDQLPQDEQLLRYAAEGAELFHDADGIAYATVEENGHKETYPINSGRFKDWLRVQFLRDRNKAPKNWAVTDALNTLRAKALYDGPEVSVFRRVAGHGDDIYVDLCNEFWEAVRVSPDGWSVVQECPVRFIRRRGMASLPYPESGGSMEDLKRFLNLGTEDGFRLLVAWSVFSLTPWGPYVILVLQGEQGSAKSTTVRVLRALVDPAVEPLRALPRDERDLAIAANNAWVLAVDNLSGIPDRLSDALCRLATGGGFATRELYTDDEEMVFSTKRPIILNGIDDITTRGDLQERSLLLSLPSIPKHERQDESTFWADFDAARPRLFGALLDAVSGALQNLGDVHLDEKPRMADFAIWGTAAEQALGWEPGSFIRAYTGNREEANEVLLGNEPVVEAVQRLLKGEAYIRYGTHIRNGWSGTATELLQALNYVTDDDLTHSRAWPKAPNILTRRMRRMAPALRSIGISYAEGEEGHGKKKVKTLRKIDDGRGGPADELDPGVREGGRVIDSPYSRAEDPNARPRAGEASENHHERSPEPESLPRQDEDYDDSAHKEVEQEVNALEKLTKRGWSRSPQLPDHEHIEPPLSPEEVERDPVAREILDTVTLYVPKCMVGMWMPTDTELLETWKESGSHGQHTPTDRPETFEQVRTRLVRMLPVLQTKRRYPDLEAAYYYGQAHPYTASDEFSCPRDGYLHVERWENEGNEEGMWVFVALRPGWQIPGAYIEKRILDQIERIEREKAELERRKQLGYEDDDFDFDDPENG